MWGCLGGSGPVVRTFLLCSALINKRDTSPYKRRARKKEVRVTPVPGERVEKPHPGGGGCWGSAVGTPRSRDGNLASLRCWRRAGLVPRLLPASVPPAALASSASELPLPVVFSPRPRFWAFGVPKPLVPQILGLSQELRPGVVGPNPDPALQLHPVLIPAGGFWGRDELRPLQGPGGCCPQAPLPGHSPEGPGPPPALRLSPGSGSGAAEAPGPGRGQPEAPELPAAFLRTTGPHQGVSRSTQGRQERCPGVTPPRASGARGKLRHGGSRLIPSCARGRDIPAPE